MSYFRLPRSGRPLFMVAAGAMLGAGLMAASPQVPGALDRPACTERVMQAVASDSAVKGSYSCFDRQLQLGLLSVGVDSDKAFADRLGQNGDYRYLHKTVDGGYVYEYDRPMTPHDRWLGAVEALALQQTRLDVRRWNLLAAWRERHDFPLAWAEITGKTQNDESHLYTFYIGADGKITAVK